MNQKELSAFAKEAAKSIKIEKDLGDFSLMLKKVIATVGKQGHRLCASELVYLPTGVRHRLEFLTAAWWLLIGSG